MDIHLFDWRICVSFTTHVCTWMYTWIFYRQITYVIAVWSIEIIELNRNLQFIKKKIK